MDSMICWKIDFERIVPLRINGYGMFESLRHRLRDGALRCLAKLQKSAGGSSRQSAGAEHVERWSWKGMRYVVEPRREESEERASSTPTVAM